ncbi:MAG TPA: sigma-70 family RNA polymerase sigma factor [Phycisphaerae bacterium]|nr:sigma-70 family RNA polymerase sigma factor [Phycisphaerae bacterium]
MATSTVAIAPETLIEEHLTLARQIAARMKRRYSWVVMEDLYSYSLLGLTMAANAWDPERGVPFPNFASQKAMFWAIDEMRKDGILRRRSAKACPRFLSLNDTPADSDQIGLDVLDTSSAEGRKDLEARDLCSTLLNHLRSQDRNLLTMYYGQHLTFKEIAGVFSISESSVCLRHRALIKKLHKLATTMNAI